MAHGAESLMGFFGEERVEGHEIKGETRRDTQAGTDDLRRSRILLIDRYRLILAESPAPFGIAPRDIPLARVRDANAGTRAREINNQFHFRLCTLNIEAIRFDPINHRPQTF